MTIDWDTELELPVSDLGKRLRRVDVLAGDCELHEGLLHDLLEHAEHSSNIAVGGLVILLNVAVGIYYSELSPASQLQFNSLRRVLFQQLTTALLDDPEIRRVALESLYDTNSIPY